MDDGNFDDLKQFIDSRISQSELLLSDKIEKLEQKVDDGFAGIGEAIDSVNTHNDEIEERVTKLEREAA